MAFSMWRATARTVLTMVRWGLDRVALAGIDWSGVQVALAYPERLPAPPEMVVGTDHELETGLGEVSGAVPLPSGDRAGKQTATTPTPAWIASKR